MSDASNGGRGVKARAREVAQKAKDSIASTVVETDQVVELIGESKQQMPERPVVAAPVKTERTLLVRICSGFVYVLLNVLALIWGPIPTAFAMSITAGICCWEFFRLMRTDAKMPNQVVGIGAAILMPLVAQANLVYILGIIFIMVMLLGLWYIVNQRVRITDIAITLFGPIYTGMTLSAIVAIRRASELGDFGAMILCIGVMASVWINDAFAYLFGSKFGKHKLVPKISPKKSWEGLFAGILGSILVWLAMFFVPQCQISLSVAITAGIVCGITGVMGDLVESRIKRGAGAKDSGNLIPGHGGLLDRSDSMLFVSISAFFILTLMGVI